MVTVEIEVCSLCTELLNGSVENVFVFAEQPFGFLLELQRVSQSFQNLTVFTPEKLGKNLMEKRQIIMGLF